MAGETIKRRWKLAAAASIVTLFVSFGIMILERSFSTTGFCTSCHSMSYPYEELKKSSHYGVIGADPNCEDCHLPPNFLLRVETHVVDGTKELIAQFTHDYSTKEKFDERRAANAHNARLNLRRWDSSPCRVCHKNVRPSSEEAELDHKKMETGGATCIDCHQNLVHDEVPEEDLPESERQGRIVVKAKAEQTD